MSVKWRMEDVHTIVPTHKVHIAVDVLMDGNSDLMAEHVKVSQT